MRELALTQIVFATDYPQAVRVDAEVVDYVKAVRALGPNERAMLEGLNVEKLIPDARERLAVDKGCLHQGALLPEGARSRLGAP